MRAARVALAAAALCTACADAFVGPGLSPNRAALFDDVWREVDLHYSFLEYKGIDWAAVGERYRPSALSATTDYAFAQALGGMLAELKDVHVSITPHGVGSTIRYVSAFEAAPATFDPKRVIPRYVPDAQTTPGGHVTFGMASADVGYVQIPSFAGTGWASEVDAALAALPEAQSLILDIRNNGGGSRSLAIEIAGRFTDRTRTFGYLRFRDGPGHGDFTDYIRQVVSPAGDRQFAGSVLLLTNRRSFSAAEDLVLAMQSMPNVSVVGDTTGGAAGGPMVRELANGWTYQLSEWIAYTADRRAFEGIGLAPDIVVAAAPPTKSVMTLSVPDGWDATIERALAIARSNQR